MPHVRSRCEPVRLSVGFFQTTEQMKSDTDNYNLQVETSEKLKSIVMSQLNIFLGAIFEKEFAIKDEVHESANDTTS